MGNKKGSKRTKYKIKIKNTGWFKNQNKLLEKECLVCSKIFKGYKKKFCSLNCFHKSRVGIKRPDHSKKMMREKIGYRGIHSWVHRNFKKLDNCEHCFKPEVKAKDGRSLIHWANKTGKYLRDRNDWLCLCQSCHSKYDKMWLKFK